MGFEIAFENVAWCAALKPSGMLSVPSRIGAADERECFGPQLESQVGARLWPIHRLDFEVSGLLLFAKNADAHRDANNWFENGLVEKTYRARTGGRSQLPDSRLHVGFDRLHDPESPCDVLWSAPLFRGKRRSFVTAYGKESRTRASWIPQGDARLWTLNPLTGRSHQLRVHLALAGFPIDGDELYGSTRTFESGIALRAFKLSFEKLSEASRRGLPTAIEADAIF